MKERGLALDIPLVFVSITKINEAHHQNLGPHDNQVPCNLITFDIQEI
jgi:hypothetical protein